MKQTPAAGLRRPSRALVILTVLIALLAVVATATGLLDQGSGASYQFTSLRGQSITIWGHGLYRYEPTEVAAQEIPQDAVTLFIGVPVLLIALSLYRRGSLRGQLLLSGTLAYFLYSYTSMAFGAAYNPLFLLYVTLFSLSLFAVIICLLEVDVAALPNRFSSKLPRGAIATFLFLGAAMLTFMWLGRIVPALISGQPPVGIDTNTTLFIQVLDLGIIVPLMVLAGVTLLRRMPLGYLLSSVALVKLVTMGLALVAMLIGQILAGVVMSPVELAMFPILVAAGLVMAFLLWRNIVEPSAAPKSRKLA